MVAGSLYVWSVTDVHLVKTDTDTFVCHHLKNIKPTVVHGPYDAPNGAVWLCPVCDQEGWRKDTIACGRVSHD